MQKKIIVLSTLALASSNLFAPVLRFYYPADQDAKDLWIQIDKGTTEGWTKMSKQDPNGRYEKKQLPSLSSESGKRYIYWKVGNSIYKTRDAYISPEIVTFGKNGQTYTVQTSTEELIGKTAKDKDLISEPITEPKFNELKKTASAIIKKYKTNTDAAIKIINQTQDITKLKNMLKTQEGILKGTAATIGMNREKLLFETETKIAIQKQINALEIKKLKTDSVKSNIELVNKKELEKKLEKEAEILIKKSDEKSKKELESIKIKKANAKKEKEKLEQEEKARQTAEKRQEEEANKLEAEAKRIEKELAELAK